MARTLFTFCANAALFASVGCGEASERESDPIGSAPPTGTTNVTVVDSFTREGSTFEVIEVASSTDETVTYALTERSPIGYGLIHRIDGGSDPLTTLELYLALVPSEPVAAERLLDQHALEAKALGREDTDVREVEVASTTLVGKSLTTCATYTESTLDAIDGSTNWQSRLTWKATKTGDSEYYATGASNKFAYEPMISAVCNESGQNIRVSTGWAYENQNYGWADYVTIGNSEWWIRFGSTPQKKNNALRVDGSTSYSYHAVTILRLPNILPVF